MDHHQPRIPVVDVDQITLEMLQSYYGVPLADLAKEIGLSLTLLKKICRKFGIARWPHRQIRSINKTAQELRERMMRCNTQQERDEVAIQLDLLEKKKILVTRGASSGLQSTLRNALFLANPRELSMDILDNPRENLPQLKYEAAYTEKKVKGPNNNSLLTMMMKMRAPEEMGSQAPPPTHPNSHMYEMGGMQQSRGSPVYLRQQFVMQQERQAQLAAMALEQQMKMNYMCPPPAPAPVLSGFQSFIPFDNSAAAYAPDMSYMPGNTSYEMGDHMIDEGMDMVSGMEPPYMGMPDVTYDADLMGGMMGYGNELSPPPMQHIPALRAGSSFEDYNFYNMPSPPAPYQGYAM